MTQIKSLIIHWKSSERNPCNNYVGEICEEEIETFDQITDALKNKALLVLDKCWDIWESVYNISER